MIYYDYTNVKNEDNTNEKTILPVLMTATISLSLLACGSNNSGESESTTNITEAATTTIVAESENATTATEPDAGQSKTNAETERTETTEVITEDSTETPAPVEVSGSTENSTILPLSYEDFNVNGFGYSNYVDLYGAGNGHEDVERISIMTTNCTAYTEYPDQMSSDTETSRGIKLGDSREQVIAAYGEPRNEVVYRSLRPIIMMVWKANIICAIAILMSATRKSFSIYPSVWIKMIMCWIFAMKQY